MKNRFVWRDKMFGRIYLVFILLSLVVYASSKVKEMPGSTSTEDNNAPDEVKITVLAKVKFNGTKRKSNVVPINSHVTLSCRVSLKKSQEYLFNLMLVSFTLPSGKQVVPGKCSVDYKTSSKRCKISMKKTTVTDQGKYRCHAQYLSGTNIIKKYGDIILHPPTKAITNHTEPHWCPSFEVYCEIKKKCVVSYDECKRNFPSPNPPTKTITKQVESHWCPSFEVYCEIRKKCIPSYDECQRNSPSPSVENNLPTKFNHPEKEPMKKAENYIFGIAAGIMLIAFLIIFALVVWIRRRRRIYFVMKEINM